MKLFARFLKSQKGFTLVELLIVIALLGALAIGLIGAIDPFEQLKKGTDTGTRDIVNQVQTSIIRYYAVKNAMPFASDPTQNTLAQAPMDAAIAAIIATGELRTDFTEIHAGDLSKIWVTGTGAPGTGEQPTAIVCYLPASKSFQADLNTKYTISGGAQPPGFCKSEGGTNDCYWCIR